MGELLDTINGPEDLRRLSVDQLPNLATEVRERIIAVVGKNGGHLSSNLGTGRRVMSRVHQRPVNARSSVSPETLVQARPAQAGGLHARLADYLALTKPRLTGLALMSTAEPGRVAKG